MFSFFKKISSFEKGLKILFKKQKFLLFLFFVFLFGCLSFVYSQELTPREAFEMGVSMTPLGGIPVALTKGISGAGQFLASLLFWPLTGLLYLGEWLIRLAGFLIQFVINNPFNVPFTKPGDLPLGNPIIKMGWTLARDFTNMLFILGFAYIGLATALGLSNFRTKQVFGNILLIALLINFTPVICGVIVDFSNIISNFFLTGLDFENVYQAYSEHRQNIEKNLKNVFSDFEIGGQVLLLLAYGIFGGLALLLFALILLIRAPIIWILVILSPIAFFFWIFRDNKQAQEWWSIWWKYFLNWSSIAIPAGFFLYLSRQALDFSGEMVATPNTAGAYSLAPQMVAVLFMVFALFLTFKASSGFIIAIAFAAVSMTSSALGKAAQHAKGLTEGRFGKALTPEDEDYDKWAKEHKPRAFAGAVSRFLGGGLGEKEKQEWGGLKGGLSAITRAALAIPFLGATYWAKPAVRSGLARIEESKKKDIAEIYGKLKDKGLDTQVTAFRNAAPGFAGSKQRIAAIKALQDSEQLEDANLSDKEISTALKDVLQFSPGQMGNIKFINPKKTVEVIKKMSWLSKAAQEAAGVYVKQDDIDRYKEKYNKLGLDFSKEEPLLIKLIEKIKSKHISSLSSGTAVELAKERNYHLFGNISETLSEMVKNFGTNKILEPFNAQKFELTGTKGLFTEWESRIDELQGLYQKSRKLIQEKKYFDSESKRPGISPDDKNDIKIRLYQTTNEINDTENKINEIENIRKEIVEKTKKLYGEDTTRFLESSAGARIGVGLGPRLPEK